ncbi:MAG: MmcQ/YjbR family DNA-binding protein [Actinobacteria bacterium]|nr:MAG: MmcQ/YjbR family DNA-binding protein [Actinomycetota bacterium]
MSRSVSVPTSRWPSTTGASPTSSSRIIRAAYATVWSASIVHGFTVIASLTLLLIEAPFSCFRSISGFPPRTRTKRQNADVRLATIEERIRDLALGFPEAYEDRPWGDFPVYKVGENKVFGWAVTREGSVDVTVKLTQEEREIAHLLPYVRTASHVGRYGWITAAVSDEESLEAALEWLRESYWLKCPTELKAAVEGED